MLPGTFQRSGRVPEQSLHNTDVQKVYGRKRHEEKSFISNACYSNDSNLLQDAAVMLPMQTVQTVQMQQQVQQKQEMRKQMQQHQEVVPFII